MLWLVVITSAYLILAGVFLVNKYLLAGPLSSPKVFAFYVGTLGVLALLIIPFVGFSAPSFFQVFLSLAAGALFVYALFWQYKAIRLFEVSRAIPAIGALIPLFTFGLIYLFSAGKETLTFLEIIAFILLIFGSVLITLKKGKLITLREMQIVAIAAFLFSLSFVFTKYVYLEQSFWPGFVWMRIGGVLVAICFFLFFKEVKAEIFKKQAGFKPKTAIIFLISQAMGAIAFVLQNWAIFLAPLAFLAIINALQGVQYVFLLVFAALFSFKFPELLKEQISREVILQKIVAILLIGGGLLVLTLK
ncbi:MAG: hypothetical protein UV65_C0006G0012 [Parcubacteria group bacterium GW2011_GWF2_43_11]|nr:MAG: hypothetical protein UV65_C0006G0012 [Parcubacteria group bacterium GW2011_GWF2_43_11]